MTDRVERQRKLRSLLSRKEDGLAYNEIQVKFMDDRKADLDMLILEQVRLGNVWVHRGRYFSKTQYERAVQR